MKILITGICGFAGSQIAAHWLDHSSASDLQIIGIDNFSRNGSWRNREALAQRGVRILHGDIRNPSDLEAIGPVDFVLDAAANASVLAGLSGQSSSRQLIDNNLSRWDYADADYADGIPETFSIDQSKHSLFGASKVAADVMVQEYGRYFNMPTCCLRGGCLTGPNHSGVELHGFLSYLVKCNLEGREYKVFGYKGKQVRDNIHSEDVARFIAAFIEAPRVAEVYNIGGGKNNSCSILEAFQLVESFTGQKQIHTYVDENRIGDHICYYSDLTKMRQHYPCWDITISLKETIEQIVAAWKERVASNQ